MIRPWQEGEEQGVQENGAGGTSRLRGGDISHYDEPSRAPNQGGGRDLSLQIAFAVCDFSATLLSRLFAEVAEERSNAKLERLLGTNRRALISSCVLMVVVAVLGLYLAFSGVRVRFDSIGRLCVQVLGGLLFLGSVLTFVASLRALGRPRVACGPDCLRLDLLYGQPIDVPLDVVECFFLGQGPSFVGSGRVAKADASNVVVRLAERATEWHKRDVNRKLGQWCDGYITIRGAWCEPIDGDLVEQMNARLAAIKRQRRGAVTSEDLAADPAQRSQG